MAQLSPTKYRVLDDLGDPVSGAYLFVYEQDTTTAADIFTDAGLTTPASNPVGPSDAEGYFSQFYATSGETFDLQCRRTSSAASELFWEELDVDSTGNEDASTFARDFGANGRLSAVGSGGSVRLQFGPPTGDDIGGSGIISGQAGTDLDDFTIKAATATVEGNLVVVGNIKRNPNTSGVETASAATDVALDGDYTAWEIRITNLKFSAAAHLRLLFSFDDDATYKTGATDYLHEGLYQGNAASVNNGVSTAAYMQITAAVAAATATGGGLDATIRITSQASRETRALCQFAHFSPGTNADCLSGTWAGQTNNTGFGKASHVRILPSAGTITFDYAVIGQP